MSKVNVVLIDSGVNTALPLFADDCVQGFTFCDYGRILDSFEDMTGHGSAIYNIIRKNHEIANIINVKLENIEEGLEEDCLINVLHYLYDNVEMDIINMSIGIAELYRYRDLYEICRLLDEKGVVLIASFDNTGSMTYPAAFDCVIGVSSGSHNLKSSEFEYVFDDVVNICAKASLQRLLWKATEYIFMSGNSFACAHVTKRAIEYYVQGCHSRNAILERFQQDAVRCYKLKPAIPQRQLFSINKTAIFPFNKEMHSIVRYSNLCDFQITAVYDVKYSGIIGMTTAQLLKDDGVLNLPIQNIDHIQWEHFDMLILGHLGELSDLVYNVDLKKQLIETALTYGKKIFAFDDLSDFNLAEPNIYFPKVEEKNLPPNRFGKMYRISKPVVGVFGTSSRQGKFTLQLKLRELLLQQGYAVGQIGTEPSALLFGMDFCFPMGYSSSVYIKEYDVIRYLNDIVNQLCYTKDIILVGSQSGTVTYDTGNIAQFNINQYHFLMGTQPDVVILCINPYDDIDYIERTINFIEAASQSEVIGIVVFPMDIKSEYLFSLGRKEVLQEQKYFKLKSQLYEKFHIPVYRLGDQTDYHQLFNQIIDYF